MQLITSPSASYLQAEFGMLDLSRYPRSGAVTVYRPAKISSEKGGAHFRVIC